MYKYRSYKEVLCFRLGNHCNLMCHGCLSNSSPNVAPIKTDLQLIKIIFTKLRKVGIKKISYSGGEPLLVKRLHDILKLGHISGFRQIVTTNGTLLPSKDLSSEFLEYIKISIWGDSKFYQKNFNLAVYSRIFRTIDYVLRKGFKVGLNVVITSEFVQRLEPFIEEILSKFPNIDNLVLHGYLPVDDNDIWNLNKKYKEYLRYYVRKINIDKSMSMKFIDFEDMGENYIVINQNGGIELQGAQISETTLISNILDMNLIEFEELLNNMWAKKYNHSIFI